MDVLSAAGSHACTRPLALCEEVEVGPPQRGGVLQRDVVTGCGDDGSADVAGHVRELFGYCVPEIGLRADSKHRATDRVGVMRAVLLGIALAGSIRIGRRYGARGVGAGRQGTRSRCRRRWRSLLA
jgi:hypothetical protein